MKTLQLCKKKGESEGGKKGGNYLQGEHTHTKKSYKFEQQTNKKENEKPQKQQDKVHH